MSSKYPIVMIHGLIGSLDVPEVILAFGETIVYTPDLIGYGKYSDSNTDNLDLQDQADHVIAFIKKLGTKVHLVGHSIGGAVSALACRDGGGLIASFTSVEGNFTLNDAFWSAQIAGKSDQEIEILIKSYKDNSDLWITNAGVPLNRFSSRVAKDWLDNQPPSTIRAQARAAVEKTKQPEYLTLLKRLMESDLPVNLVSGATSAAKWDVPKWANQKCTLRINIPGVGHMMMAESVHGFSAAILQCTRYCETIACERSDNKFI